MKRTGLWVLVSAVSSLAGAPVSGQAASQYGKVVQKIDQTTITIEYSRPVARGRDTIFGGIVHWGETWTPGANKSTTLETDGPITLNGHEVAAGRYSVWMVTSESDPWEVVLDPRDTLFHTQRPEPEEDQIRFLVEPVLTPHAEVLTWSFPLLGPSYATVEMRWADRAVPMEIETPIDYTVAIAEEDAEPYEGRYEVHYTELMLERWDMEDRASFIVISYDGERLEMKNESWPPGFGQLLLPLSDGIFKSGTTVNGSFTGAGQSFFEFVWKDGVVTGFEVRNSDDELSRVGTLVREGG